MTDLQDLDQQHAAATAATKPTIVVEPVNAQEASNNGAAGTAQAAPATPSKACNRCGVVKPLTDYWKNVNSKDGLQVACKPCLSDRNRKSAAGRGPGRPAGSTAASTAAPAVTAPPADPDIDLGLLTDAIALLRGRGVETVKQSKLLKLLDALDVPGLKDTVG